MPVTADAVNVLLVDDNPANLIALAAVLDAPEYRLITATSGQEALDLTKQEELAVILLDVRMPGMSGLDVARALKADPRTRLLPIIFVTAVESEVEHVYQAYTAGAVDYLIKPLDKDAVRRKVATFVELFVQRREIERQAAALRESERREFELQLKELQVASDDRYRKLVEGIDHVIAWTAEPDSLDLSFVSRQAARVLGYPLEEFTAPGFWRGILHPDDREAFDGAVERARREGVDQAVNHRLIAQNGRFVWVHTGLSLERPSAGRLPRGEVLHGVSTDVSDLKRAEEKQRLLAKASASFAESLDPVEILSRLGQVLVPNLADWSVVDGPLPRPSVAHVEPGRALDLSLALAERGPLDPSAGYVTARVFQTGRPVLANTEQQPDWPERVLGVRAALPGTLRPGSHMVVPLRARDHSLVVLLCASAESRGRFAPHDLALVETLAARAALAIDNAELYRTAMEARRSREELLALLTHDLGAPLQTISSSAADLERSEGLPGEVRSSIQVIRQAAERSAHLLEDLLHVQQSGDGK